MPHRAQDDSSVRSILAFLSIKVDSTLFRFEVTAHQLQHVSGKNNLNQKKNHYFPFRYTQKKFVAEKMTL